MALTYNNSSPNLTSMLNFTDNNDSPTELLAVNVGNLNDLDRFIRVQEVFSDLRSKDSQTPQEDNNHIVDYGSFREIYTKIKDQVSGDDNWRGPKGPSGAATPGPQGQAGPMGGIQTINGISFQDANLTDKFEEINRILSESDLGIQFTKTSLSYPNGTIVIVGGDLHSHNGYIEL